MDSGAKPQFETVSKILSYCFNQIYWLNEISSQALNDFGSSKLKGKLNVFYFQRFPAVLNKIFFLRYFCHQSQRDFDRNENLHIKIIMYRILCVNWNCRFDW